MEVEFYKDHAGEHRWRITSLNGKIVAASSEGFVSMEGAIKNCKLTAKALAEWVLEG